MSTVWTRVMEYIIDRTDHRAVLGVSERWRPNEIDDYFIDMRGKIGGLPEHGESRESALRAGLPVEICQWALGFYQRWHEANRSEDLEWFIHCADLLVETQERCGPLEGSWLYHEPGPYRRSTPWPSAMAQGEAISVLVRASRLCPEAARYEAAAKRAMCPFQRTVDEGGTVSVLDSGAVCLEEYPSSPPSHVLNGWIFAWMGLSEYARAFDDSKARDLANRSLEGLVGLLPRYDTGYWSSYDLFPGFAIRFLASRRYHRLHIAQLEAMFRVTREALFQTHAQRWADYICSPSCQRRYAAHRFCYKAYCCLTGW